MILYIAMTRDKYQLPMAVAETTEELARMMGVSGSTIRSHLSKVKSGIVKKPRYEKVVIEKDD